MQAGSNRVLVYHKIDYQRELGISVIHPTRFRRQVAFLVAQGYTLNTLSAAYSAPMFSPDEIALTFDDGYAGVFHYAFPILQEFKVPGTVFLISGFLGKVNNWDVQLAGRRFPHLTMQQVKELSAAGWEMGSHTISHRCLIGLPRQEIWKELNDSKRSIEDLLGRRVKYLAAPFGKVNRLILELARESGYLGVCGFYPLRYWREAPPAGFVLRLAVYATDTDASIARKLGKGRRLYREALKQNLINFCSNGTLLVQSLR